jgi:hypothetical protein
MSKKLRKYLVVLVAFAVVFNVIAFQVAKGDGGVNSKEAPAGYSPITINQQFLVPSQADVLLIQETLPWGSNANAAVLSALGYSYDITNMSSVASIDLTKYAFVLIASDQNQSFYDAYAANQSLFDNFVKKGGVLVFFAAYYGWGEGVLNAPLPGGVTAGLDLENYNLIVDASSPIVTDVYTEGIPLTNADLYGDYCSHINFSNLAALVASGSITNLDIILEANSSGQPTLIQYQVGLGTVIASGNTWEIAYDWDWAFARKAMDDIFKYAYMLGSKHTITATAGFGGTITPSGAVTVSSGSSQTFTITANLKFMINKVLVDGSAITITNPSQMTYTFNNVKSDHTIEAQFVSIPDTSPPTITKISGIDVNAFQDVTINKNSYTFTVEAYDDSGIARMVVKANGVVQIDKNSLDPTIYLSEGTNTVEVTVYDTYGNYATKSFKVISDTKPPVVIVDDMPASVSSQVITVKGTAIDTGSGVRSLTVNGDIVNVTLQGGFEAKVTLTQGANAITIEATDKLGNKGTTVINLSYAQPQAKQSYMVVLKVGSPSIEVNGTSKKIDTQGSKPIIQNGRTLLPIRTLIESLSGTVAWDAKEQKVTITLNGHSIVLWIGKTTALVDGSNATLDVAPLIINGRTYIPLRFVSEHLGGSVNWDATTQTITVYYWP